MRIKQKQHQGQCWVSTRDKLPFITEYTVILKTAQKCTLLPVSCLVNRCIELFKTTGRIKDERRGFSADTVTR